MELSVQNVYGLLIRSKLLGIEEAKTMYQRWLSESKGMENVELFARWMVTHCSRRVGSITVSHTRSTGALILVLTCTMLMAVRRH